MSSSGMVPTRSLAYTKTPLRFACDDW